MVAYWQAGFCLWHDILSSRNVFSRHHRKARLLFGLSDVLLTALAFEAAYQTRVALELERDFYIVPPVKALLLGFSILVWVLSGLWLHVYDRVRSAAPRVVCSDLVRQCAAAAASVVIFQFALRLDLSRPFLGFFVVYNFLFLLVYRFSARSLGRVLRSQFGAPHYVMVVGVGDRARYIGRLLEDAADYGIRLAGFFAPPGVPVQKEIRIGGKYDVYPLSELPELLRRHVIDEIIFALDSRNLSDLEDIFLLCDEEGVRTQVSVDFFPHIHSRVYLDRLGPAPLLTFSATPHDEVRLMLKRAIDVVLAASALVLAAPFMLLVALLIRLTSPGPVIFRQVRCGFNGRRFVCYKFRSMCWNAEELKPSVAHLNQKKTVFKIPDDPRLTKIGRWLRKFSIDELPQLWNVLKGDMSLVGPRPAIPEEVEQYQRWQRRRLRMRPGLTCLWALAGRDTLDFESWMKLDMQYIDNWSLALDWNIMLRTIPRVLTGKGAH